MSVSLTLPDEWYLMSQQSILEYIDKKRRRSSSEVSDDSTFSKPLRKKGSLCNRSLENLSEFENEGVDECLAEMKGAGSTGQGARPKEQTVKGKGSDSSEECEIKRLLIEMRKEQQSLRQSVETRLSNLEETISNRMKKEFSEMRDHVDIEVTKLSDKIEMLEQKVAYLEVSSDNKRNEPFDPEVTVVALNMREHVEEEIFDVAEEMIQNALGLEDISPVNVLRLKSKTGKPGVVKIECRNKEDKIEILRNKNKLKDTRDYKKVYLRTSMSHSDRLMQSNFQQILRVMPDGHRFRMTGNGRIILREEDTEERQENGDREESVTDNQMPDDGDISERSQGRRGGQGRSNRGRGRGRGRRGRNYNR